MYDRKKMTWSKLPTRKQRQNWPSLSRIPHTKLFQKVGQPRSNRNISQTSEFKQELPYIRSLCTVMWHFSKLTKLQTTRTWQRMLTTAMPHPNKQLTLIKVSWKWNAVFLRQGMEIQLMLVVSVCRGCSCSFTGKSLTWKWKERFRITLNVWTNSIR